MDERRARALPDRFATRVPEHILTSLRNMERAGEHGELTIELTATLANTRATVSDAEQRELRALLEATGMPTGPLEQLAVEG